MTKTYKLKDLRSAINAVYAGCMVEFFRSNHKHRIFLKDKEVIVEQYRCYNGWFWKHLERGYLYTLFDGAVDFYIAPESVDKFERYLKRRRRCMFLLLDKALLVPHFWWEGDKGEFKTIGEKIHFYENCRRQKLKRWLDAHLAIQYTEVEK